MISSCTFIPSQRAKDLLCMLWVEFGTLGETRLILIELRSELGPVEFARFEKDLARQMDGWDGKSARTAIHGIIRAAIRRGEEHGRAYQITRLDNDPKQERAGA